MSILDAAIMVGLESTYGTPATLTRAFEGKADTFKREQSRLESVGFRAGMHTLRDDRVVTVNMGGAGSLEVDFLNKGMGLILQGAMGANTAPAQVAATSAYDHQFDTAAAGPTESFTIQVLRSLVDGATEPFTYHGCKITGWELSQSVDGLAVISFDFDFEDSDHATAAGTPSYPADATPFDWTDCVVTLDPDGTPETLDVIDLSFSADLAMKTDRRYLRGSALKKEPVRNGVPTYEGEITIDFDSVDRYDEWTAQTTVDMEIKWTGGEIEPGYNDELTLRMQAVQWKDDANPESSLGDISSQSLPFQALHDGTNSAVTLTTRTSDTTY